MSLSLTGCTESARNEPEDSEEATEGSDSNDVEVTSDADVAMVEVEYEGEWSGSVGNAGSVRTVDGTGPETIEVPIEDGGNGQQLLQIDDSGRSRTVRASLEKADDGPGVLTVRISIDGDVVSEGSTTERSDRVDLTVTVTRPGEAPAEGTDESEEPDAQEEQDEPSDTATDESDEADAQEEQDEPSDTATDEPDEADAQEEQDEVGDEPDGDTGASPDGDDADEPDEGTDSPPESDDDGTDDGADSGGPDGSDEPTEPTDVDPDENDDETDDGDGSDTPADSDADSPTEPEENDSETDGTGDGLSLDTTHRMSHTGRDPR